MQALNHNVSLIMVKLCTYKKLCDRDYYLSANKLYYYGKLILCNKSTKSSSNSNLVMRFKKWNLLILERLCYVKRLSS